MLRVLANLLDVSGFDFETSQDVLSQATGSVAGSIAFVPKELLSNAALPVHVLSQEGHTVASPLSSNPVVASIYQLDSIVRRAASLQLTADARRYNASMQGAEA